jgi:hypothetical protein
MNAPVATATAPGPPGAIRPACATREDDGMTPLGDADRRPGPPRWGQLHRLVKLLYPSLTRRRSDFDERSEKHS